MITEELFDIKSHFFGESKTFHREGYLGVTSLLNNMYFVGHVRELYMITM